MTQSQLDCAVALATGEDPETIRHMGFSLADPRVAQDDLELCNTGPHTIDWDELDARRNGASS